MTMLVSGVIEVHDDRYLAAFESLLSTTMELSRVEVGCHDYWFARDLNRPTIYYVFEHWADEAAWKAHLRAEHIREFGRQFAQLGRIDRSFTSWDAGDGRDLASRT